MKPERSPKFTVSHCRFEDEYSLDIKVDDIHVDLNTHAYNHRHGHHVRVAFFNLTRQDIGDLGILILDKANELQRADATAASMPKLAWKEVA